MKLSFIKLDINIMNDTKIKIIRKMPDGDSLLVLWIGILCLGMQSGRPGILEVGDGIPFTLQGLHDELDIPLNTVTLGLETFKKLKMIEFFDDQSIYITNFEKHQELDKIEFEKEKVRLRVQKHRELKRIPQNNVTVTGVTCNKAEIKCNDTDQDKDKETYINKELDIDIDIDTKISFIQFWDLYDKKVDRPKCEKKWNKLSFGDQRDILNYIPDYKISQPQKQYRKNPETFFNNRSWENEIITSGKSQKPSITLQTNQMLKQLNKEGKL